MKHIVFFKSLFELLFLILEYSYAKSLDLNIRANVSMVSAQLRLYF